MDGEMENAVDCGLGEDRAYSNPGEEEEYATASDADEDGSSSSASLLESDSGVIPPDVDDAVAEHIDSVLGSEGVTAFIAGYMKMSKNGQRTSLVTALSGCLLKVNVIAQLGSVYAMLIVSHSVERYRKQIQQNIYAIPQHGNTGNRNAKFVDEVPLKEFFTRLAEVHVTLFLFDSVIKKQKMGICDGTTRSRNIGFFRLISHGR
ncbi:Hypothetical protein PHPALM_6590 [Phytophthora palmivora]|uniref:Uncharacterized protein n=1 Tax=Phytophthora palmivora TaxID=4796 RepID=A0A2P4YEH0_9STRA|nr:Hypothetical protein PHPALM_6590 [Phytophthora palmivora]